jgi:hypothetical protein
MKQSGKFTIVEAAAIILLSMGTMGTVIALYGGGRARELTKFTMCGTHVGQIGKVLQLYYADYNDAFPVINPAGENAKTGLGFAGNPDANQNVYRLSGAFPQDDLSLLVYKGFVGWDVFLCPSTDTRLKDRSDPTDMYGFGAGTSPSNAHKNFIDYGLHIPQHYTAPGIEHKAWLNQNAEAPLAIMADRPPGPSMLATQWGPNHPKDGAQVLTFGGTVKMMTSGNGIAKGPGGTTYRNMLGAGPDGICTNNIYAKDMGPDIVTGATTQPGAVRLGDITPPGPTDSRFDSVIYWRANP